MKNLMHTKERWYHQNDGIKMNTLKPKTWATVAIVVLATAILVAISWKEEQVNKMIAVPTVYATTTKEIQSIVPKTSEQEEIATYIKEVFGRDAQKAFQLLSCENSSLNPSAVNVAGNHPVGSRDIGVFQINEYWQKVQGKFLFNWKINVDIAHQLFEENGKSFKLWTCGRKLGV